ncbi:MAG: B-box zinc finger protein [Myxococcaceae bacterium]|nr:B-box zinc finger protein [Myxococcaceae bacterium]
MATRFVPSDAACPDHPERAAVDICVRCGRFLCQSCVTSRAAKVMCKGCAMRPMVRAEDPFPPLAVALLVMGVLGLVVLPLGWAAGLMGQRQLNRIARGAVTERGEFAYQWARGLGWASLAVTVVMLLAGAWTYWGDGSI